MLIPPGFLAERCVRYRYSYSECSRCADVCPHGAVQLHNAGVEIEASRCQGCGLCAAVCATEALAEKSVSIEHLLKIAGSKRQLIISCAPSGVRSDAVVPCLGAINPVVLAELSHRGIAIQLAGSAHCGQCTHAPRGGDLLQSHLAARTELCNAGENDQWASLTVQDSSTKSRKGKEGHDAGRRGLFRRFVGYSADAMSDRAAVPPAPLKAIRAAAPFLPERKAILNGLYVARGDEPVRVVRSAALPAENLFIAQGCTHCEACVRVCPTGALQLVENNSTWRIAFLEGRCVACEVCAEVCQPKVLRPREGEEVIVNLLKARLLLGVPKQRCTRCDRVFVSDGDSTVCPICQGDDDDFASIFG